MDEPVILPYGDPAFLADPFPLLRELREQGPVRRVEMATGAEAWLVTRYEDALKAFSDQRLSSDLRDATDPRLLEQLPTPRVALQLSMIRVNPPDHTRLRRLVSKAFTPRRVTELRPRVQEITDRLLDRIAPAGQADLVEEFALPLPVTVISELLGVPEEDRHGFQEWTNTMVGQRGIPDRTAMNKAMERMWEYMERLLAAKRSHPADDMLSSLIAARDQEQRLNEDELVAMAFLLLVAGYITTVNLIGSGLVALLTHPKQLAALAGDPALLPDAVEEFLRYDGPVNPGIARFATEDVEIGGVTIPRGATVLVGTAVADRDPAQFPDPDELDLSRSDNPHLAFGHGIHYCLGAPLARLEGQIAIGTALRRLPDLALAVPPEELEWQVSNLRGPKHLPVTFIPN